MKYFFAQADEILLKINALKQYYVRKQELFYFRLCSCDVAYSSAQQQLVFRNVCYFLAR